MSPECRGIRRYIKEMAVRGSGSLRRLERWSWCIALFVVTASLNAQAVVEPMPIVSVTASADPGITALVHVTVVPMDRERLLRDQTVVVEGARITALGPADRVRVPAGARRIDGRGKFLIPGLADMHVHIGFGAGPADTGNRETLFLYLANGITTVRDMHSGGADSPQRMFRDQIAAGQVLGPRVYTAGDPVFSSDTAAARTTAALKAAGHPFVKIYGFERPVYDSVVAVAVRVGLRLVGHVPDSVGLKAVLADHWASVEHLTGYPEYLAGASLIGVVPKAEKLLKATWMQPEFRLDAAKLRAIARVTRQAGVWNCPTLLLVAAYNDPERPAHVRTRTDADALSAALQTSWYQSLQRVTARLSAFQLQITKALHDAGAGLLLGTDSGGDGPDIPPGFRIHRELQLLVQAGLTPYEALATGTRNVATFLGTSDSTGTVAVGKRADLVLLDRNPLADIRATAGPAGVMVGGQWLPRAEIDARLDAWQTHGVFDLGAVRRVLWAPREP